MTLPSAFVARMKARLGDEYDAFEASLIQPPPVSLRLNPRKPCAPFPELIQGAPAWCAHGRYLSERPNFAMDPLWHAGGYYVQEASSMVLEAVLRPISFNEHYLALDLCAAPGGKSTLLAGLLPDDATLIANEVISARVSILNENITRWGRANVLITQNDPETFRSLSGSFDLVVVDAPCSGEGLWRKQPDAIREWSPDTIRFCALRQQRILSIAAELVSEDGILIYSTCTYAEEENEHHLTQLISTNEFESIRQEPLAAMGFVEREISSNVWSYSAYPHRVAGEGFCFFVLKKIIKQTDKQITKRTVKPSSIKPDEYRLLNNHLLFPDDWIMDIHSGSYIGSPRPTFDWRHTLKLRFIRTGVQLGAIKGKDFTPAHEGLICPQIHYNYPYLEADKTILVQYLAKQAVSFETPLGYCALTYQSIPIGWIKQIGTRINNYYPSNFRIKHPK